MVDFSAIAGLSSSLKASSDIAKAMIGIRDGMLIREKAIELTSVIMSAQSGAMAAHAAQAELIERVRDLEKQIVELEDWEREKARYQLAEVAPGVFAYEAKPEMLAGEPSHRICAGCYQSRSKRILQSVSRSSGRGTTDYLRCDGCSAEIPIAFRPIKYPPVPPARVRRDIV